MAHSPVQAAAPHATTPRIGRRHYLALAGAYVLSVVSLEIVAHERIASLLRMVNLEGLALFTWVFIALIAGLELFRRHLEVLLAETSAVLHVVETRGVDPRHAAQRALVDDELDLEAGRTPSDEHVRAALLARRDRLDALARSYATWGEKLPGQLGLLGTVTGLAGAVDHMVHSAADARFVGARAISAMGTSGLDTVFSSTMAGIYIVVAVLVLAGLLDFRIRRVHQRIQRVLRTAPTCVTMDGHRP